MPKAVPNPNDTRDTNATMLWGRTVTIHPTTKEGKQVKTKTKQGALECLSFCEHMCLHPSTDHHQTLLGSRWKAYSHKHTLFFTHVLNVSFDCSVQVQRCLCGIERWQEQQHFFFLLLLLHHHHRPRSILRASRQRQHDLHTARQVQHRGRSRDRV